MSASEPSRWACFPAESLDYAVLDPGIRDLVRWLVTSGYVTVDSGDGKYKGECGWEEGSYLDVPHVYIEVESATEAEAAVDALHQALSPYVEGDRGVSASYGPGGPWLVGLHGFTNDDVPAEK